MDELWEELPPEIILEIASYLEGYPVARVSLALTTSRNFKILGTHVLNFENPNIRFRLLQRLDKDGVNSADVLCSICRIFHPPRMAHGWSTEKEGSRACVRFGEMQEKTNPIFLPFQITLDMVNIWTKHDRLLPAIYSRETLRRGISYTHEDEQAQLWHFADIKVIDGHLLVKTEEVLCPGTHRDDSLQAVPKLLQMMEASPETEYCCGHYKWSEFQPFVFNPDESDKIVKHSYLSEMAQHHCLWTHPEACHFKRGPKNESKWFLGMIYSCNFCYTDMTFSTFNSHKGEKSYVVFTSWKDLGPGKDVDDRFWRSHLDGADAMKAHRTCKLGSIHKAWEGTVMHEGRWVKTRVDYPYRYTKPV
ncbi:Fc.00g108710.m01.CDS01 [Cosmosporella sp. VM-42]